MSTAEIPRGLAFANGVKLSGVDSFSVDNNGFFQADTFRLGLVLSAQPKEMDLAWWSEQTSIQVELLAGYPAEPDNFSRADLTSHIIGYADDIEIDPIGDTITLVGRDLTSKLLDAKRSITFQEATSSSIVARIAAEVGLKSQVTSTKAPTGTFYQIMHRLVNSNVTYWEIVTKLAQLEQFLAYVQGDVLHFEPRVQEGVEPFELKFEAAPVAGGFIQANTQSISLSRNLTVARDINVTVLSWNAKAKREIKAMAHKARIRNKNTAGVAKSDQPPQEYIRSIPGLSQDQAQAQANALLLQLSQHEMNLSFSLPADDRLTARRPIRLTGTNSKFDQLYFPSSVVRSFSFGGGYTISGSAKNQSPDQEFTQ